MPDYEVSILFRESWCLGGGKVLLENFFTVLCERGHMTKCLNLPLAHKIPRFDPDLQELYVEDQEDKHQVACHDLYQTFVKGNKYFKEAEKEITKLGSEKIYEDIRWS
jgi:hypothetical protein